MVSLKKGEWSCYRCGQFNRGGMVMLEKLPVSWRKNGHVTEVAN